MASAARTSAGGGTAPSPTIAHTVSPPTTCAAVCACTAPSSLPRYSTSRGPSTCASCGWMRFRCAMRPMPSLRSASPVNSRASPPRPAAHARPRRSRRSSNSCRTLSRGIGRPLGDQPVGRLDVLRGGQRLAQRRVAEHLGQLREQLEVRLGGVLGHEHGEDEAHRLAVRRLEGDGLGGAHEGADRLLQRADAAVGNRDAVAEAGGAELLAVEERIEDPRARDLPRILEQQADLLEQALLAAGLETEEHVIQRQEARDEIHQTAAILAHACGMRLSPCEWRGWNRSLNLITWRSSLSTSPSMAAYMS